MENLTFNNSTYYGETQNGVMHGEGSLVFDNGDKYEGEFQHGSRTGRGTYTWASGTKHIGDWVNSVETGKGFRVFTNGTTITGEWKDGKQNGYGTITYKHTGRYLGNFVDDELDGEVIWQPYQGNERKLFFKNGKKVKENVIKKNSPTEVSQIISSNTITESYKKNNEGYIYILSNESFSNNLIKIGQSKDRYRQDELYTTGVPTKFRVEYYALVNNYVDIERRVHSLLRQYRPNKNREFFNCSISQAINVIRQNSEVHKEYVYYKSPEEIEAEREKQEKLKKERDKKREEEKIKRDLKIKQDNIFREEQQKRNKEQFSGIMFLTGVILSFITLFFYQNFWLFLLTMACFIVWMFMNE